MARSKRAISKKNRPAIARRYSNGTETTQALVKHWQQLCDLYLPVFSEDGFWRFSRGRERDDPYQGWKLHVSATVLSANKVFEKVASYLSSLGVLFKAPSSLKDLSNINSGLKYGFSQVGKFITVYPKTAEEAVSLAHELNRMTRGFPGPDVPFDRPFSQNSRVSYRYGAFRSMRIRQADGTFAPALKNSKGKLIPDLRAPGTAVPDWVTDPFPKARNRHRQDTPVMGIRAYEAISQRGKGGVYRAIDLSAAPVRLCILKEGRKNGETDWNGRDGHWRVRHETSVLRRLRKAGVMVPQVYSTFQRDGHYYLAIELIEGQDLHSLMKKKSRRLPMAEAIDYGSQISDLLARIHAAGWVWRDCKPRNFIRTSAGTLRPLDFEGACKVSRPDPTPWGTPGYVPPECRREPANGSRLPEDLFALGAVLHQLLTGRIPDKNSRPAPVEELRRQVPKALREIIRALLDPSPQARPGAREVAKVLKMIRHN